MNIKIIALIITLFEASADIVLDLPLQNKSPSLLAQERCTSISQEARLGPVRNQGRTGWCYGYTAADMIGFALNLPPEKQVSAIAVSSNYASTSWREIDQIYADNLKKRDDPLRDFRLVNIDDRGNVTSARIAIRDKLENQQAGKGIASSLNDKLSQGGFVDSAFEVTMSKDKICLTDDMGQLEDGSFDPYTANIVAEQMVLAQKRHCSSNKDSFSGIVDTQTELLKAQAKFYQEKCSVNLSKKQNFRISEYNFSTYNPTDQRFSRSEEDKTKGLRAIDKALNNGEIIGLTYEPKSLIHTRLQAQLSDHSLHSSTIIGRKFEDGKCFYQIRNSWGPKCLQYLEDNNKVRCEHGGSIYVEENTLLDTLVGIQLIENTRPKKPQKNGQKIIYL